jgi:hypothetical protein
MIEALVDRPGFLRIGDASGHVHVVSVFGIRAPRVAGPQTTYVRVGTADLFVRCSADEFKAQAQRARALRKAQSATAGRAQLELDFHEKREASAVTPTPRTTLPPEESEVICGGS